MFVKPKTEATPETQYGPEAGVFVIGTGITEGAEPEQLDGQLTLEEAVSVNAGGALAELAQPAELESANARETSEDIEKTREFEAVGRVKEDELVTRKKRLKGEKTPLRRAVGALLTVLLAAALLAGAAVFIAEPWVAPETDDYTGPAEEALEPVTLSVGEVYPLGISLRPNEKIASVDLDADLLLYNDDVSVTALGEYFKTTAVVKTKEIRVLQKGYDRDIVIFGRDLTEEYFSLRAKLRELMDVEAITAERTELRDLRVITMEFSISGIPHSNETIPGEIEAEKTQDVAIAGLDREAGQVAVVRSDNPAVALVTEVNYDISKCDFVVTGVAKGTGTITATIGRWKQVTPEVYAEFLASPFAASAPETRENEIFVTTRDVTYDVTVAARRIQYYYYRGRWYAY